MFATYDQSELETIHCKRKIFSLNLRSREFFRVYRSGRNIAINTAG